MNKFFIIKYTILNSILIFNMSMVYFIKHSHLPIYYSEALTGINAIILFELLKMSTWPKVSKEIIEKILIFICIWLLIDSVIMILMIHFYYELSMMVLCNIYLGYSAYLICVLIFGAREKEIMEKIIKGENK